MASRDDDRDAVQTDKGTGVTPLMLLLGLLFVLFIIFLGQNTEDVPIEFLWWNGEPPLFIVLLVTMAASGFVAIGGAGIWRRQRRRQRAER